MAEKPAQDKTGVPGSAAVVSWASLKSPSRETVVAWKEESATDDPTISDPKATMFDALAAAGEAKPPASDETPPPSGPPEYILRRRIATGGQGEVWDALQTSLDREVAVKIVRAEVNKEVSQSFLHEAYTVAALDHPNIVPVYELSRTRVLGLDCHLLAMKLLRGKSWDKHLETDRSAKSFEEDQFYSKHLKIFLAVCHAMAYAHSKKLLHLDLKPAQVVLGDFGEVYLLDWGLSMAVDERPATLSSSEVPKFRSKDSTSAPSGTPAYMAPEQTLGAGQALGYHTDIYLLGAILFEIVAGYPPHFASTVSNAYRRAKHNEVNSLPENCPDALRTLIESALTTNPNTRPQSVDAMRLAVEDYLSGSNRKRESREIVTEVRHRLDETEGRDRYQSMRDADRRLQRALNLWPDNSDAFALRQDVIGQWLDTALDSGDLRLARTLAPEIAAEERRTAYSRRIQYAEAARRQIRRQRTLLIAFSAVAAIALIGFWIKYTLDQGEAQLRLAEERDRAEGARQQADGLVNFLIDDLYRGLEPLGRLDLLGQVAQESVSYFQSTPVEIEDGPGLRKRSVALRNVADVLRAQGSLDAAQDAYTQSINIAAQILARDPASHPTRKLLADNWAAYSRFQYRQRDLDNAMESEQTALALRRELAAADPGNVPWNDDLASSFNHAGVINWRQGDIDEAVENLNRSIEIRRLLLAKDPNNEELLANMGWTLGTLGVIRIDQGELSEALQIVQRSLEMRRRLAAKDPQNAIWQGRVSWILGSYGELHYLMGNVDAALEAFHEALRILHKLAEQDPTNSRTPNELAWMRQCVSLCHEAMGNHDAALIGYRESLSQRARILEGSPNDFAVLEELAWNHYLIGQVEMRIGNLSAANESLLSGIGITRDLFRQSPTNMRSRSELAWMLVLEGRLARRRGDEAAARRAWEEAITILAPAIETSGRVDYLGAQSAALLLLGRDEEARPVGEALLAKGYRSPDFIDILKSEEIGGWMLEKMEAAD